MVIMILVYMIQSHLSIMLCNDIDTDIQLRFIISEWSDFSNPSYTRTTSTDSLGGYGIKLLYS